MGLYDGDIEKVPQDLTMKQCYERIYNWHTKIGKSMLVDDGNYGERYQHLMKILPPPQKATKEDMVFIFMR